MGGSYGVYGGYSREINVSCLVLGYTARRDPSFTLNLEARYGYWPVGNDDCFGGQERGL